MFVYSIQRIVKAQNIVMRNNTIVAIISSYHIDVISCYIKIKYAGFVSNLYHYF